MTAECDFLVIGAGSAGCLVARTLDLHGYKVRLVEAGPPTPPLRRPVDYLQTFGTEQDWRFRTVPQPGLAGRRLDQPRGRGPGGSTRINAMIWYPPRDADLQRLHRAGGDDWSPNRLAASLTAVTQAVSPQPPRWLSETARRFLSRSTAEAVDPPHAFARMADRQGRLTAADLLADRPTIETIAAHVDRVLFGDDPLAKPHSIDLSPTRAVGVLVHPHSADATCEERKSLPLFARHGVILCGGSFASPSILLRSGIGAPDAIAAHGLKPRIAINAVGQNLVDHLLMPITFATSGRDRFPTPLSTADLARWQIAATGPAASNLAEAGAIYSLNSASSSGREFQVHVTPTHYLLYPDRRAPAAMTVGINLCQPRSRGAVDLAAADPFTPPLIDPGYLTETTDLDDLVAAVIQVRQLVAAGSLATGGGAELIPGGTKTTVAAIAKAVRRFSQTLYHPCGTCRIGVDADSVVDPDCRVRGTESLHVIDASVLPEVPTVNPNATVMMIAHHAATRLAASFDAAS